jgi:phage terminase large subunit-like protein
VLTVDTAYGDKEENSWNAATTWGIWHGKEEDPRAMLMEAWRGRPPLLGDGRTKGLVEIIHGMATRRMVDVILIEKKTRGVDLYNELDRLLGRDHPWVLEFFEPTGRGDKSARLTSTTSRFTKDLVWAPAKKWADLVIDEICAQPRAKFSDLSDCTTSALIYLRETNRLVLPAEHAAEVRRSLVFRGAGGRFDAGEMYEGA